MWSCVNPWTDKLEGMYLNNVKNIHKRLKIILQINLNLRGDLTHFELLCHIDVPRW